MPALCPMETDAWNMEKRWDEGGGEMLGSNQDDRSDQKLQRGWQGHGEETYLTIVKMPRAGSQAIFWSKERKGSRARSESYGFRPKVGSFILLALPKWPVVVKVDDVGGVVGRNALDLEAFSHLALDELRSTLIPLVCVLVEDSGMVLLRTLATFDHQQDQAVKLSVGVIGVVHMCG